MLLLSLCIALLTVGITSADLFKDDGVLVSQLGTVREIEGVWTVIVVIHPPVMPNLLPWSESVGQAIFGNSSDRLSEDDKLLWEARLQRILNIQTLDDIDYVGQINNPEGHSRMRRSLLTGLFKLARGITRVAGSCGLIRDDHPVHDIMDNMENSRRRMRQRRSLLINGTNDTLQRSKRGLVDIVGHVAKSLFGVATSDDIAMLKQAIKESQHNSRVMFHNQEQLLTVFNKTRDYIENNQQSITEIEVEIQQMFRRVQDESNRTNALTRSVNSLIMARKIDSTLEQMEAIVADFISKSHVFHLQRMQLERGWLTEDILPPRILGNILRQIQSNHMGTLPPHWYYQYVRVESMWERPNQLAFRVVIPALSAEEFLHYGFKYFYVPVGNHLRVLSGRDEIVVNTATGHSFVPVRENCIGRDPTVCRPYKVDMHDNCETSLVSGSGFEQCVFLFEDRGNRTIDVYQDSVRAQEIIVVGYRPTNVIRRCIGEPAEQISVFGPTIINLDQNCNLSCRLRT